MNNIENSVKEDINIEKSIYQKIKSLNLDEKIKKLEQVYKEALGPEYEKVYSSFLLKMLLENILRIYLYGQHYRYFFWKSGKYRLMITIFTFYKYQSIYRYVSNKLIEMFNDINSIIDEILKEGNEEIKIVKLSELEEEYKNIKKFFLEDLMYEFFNIRRKLFDIIMGTLFFGYGYRRCTDIKISKIFQEYLSKSKISIEDIQEPEKGENDINRLVVAMEILRSFIFFDDVERINVIDYGCGKGAFIRCLTSSKNIHRDNIKNKLMCYYGLDIIDELLEQTKREAQNAGTFSNHIIFNIQKENKLTPSEFLICLYTLHEFGIDDWSSFLLNIYEFLVKIGKGIIIDLGSLYCIEDKYFLWRSRELKLLFEKFGFKVLCLDLRTEGGFPLVKIYFEKTETLKNYLLIIEENIIDFFKKKHEDLVIELEELKIKNNKFGLNDDEKYKLFHFPQIITNISIELYKQEKKLNNG